MYPTFFEIGGHVVETYVEGPGHIARPVMYSVEKALKDNYNVPKPLARKALKEVKTATGIDVGKLASGGGRGRRAGWAIRTAAILALADGPIPVGDAIAAGFLTAYATYEVVRAVGDIKEGMGY
jgi:hypothetical protein